MIASGPQIRQDLFLNDLTEGALQALPYLFDFWAMPHQVPPGGDWRTWVILGGRGAGKTRAGAEWVRAKAEGSRPRQRGAARRIAIIGETYDQAREVMVLGDSGIMACSPPDRAPQWIANRRILRWPNGAEAQVFSAFDPEALRGPQFDAVWADEVAKWKNGEATWDMVEFGLRLGDLPQAVRIVVAVDPPATGHRGSDACGIVVAGVSNSGPPHTWRGYVLEDASVQAATPLDWANAAVAAYRRHNADRLVAEVNQGGDMVEAIVRQIDPLVSYTAVNARKGKVARAEPVAALYEQGRIKHLRGLGALEDQMCLMTTQGFTGKGSPDRVDALVWALHELMIGPAQNWRAPRMRRL